MFWPDVVALKEFYATPLGVLAARSIERNVRSYWTDAHDEIILGIGFTLPFLVPYLGEAERVLACMPAQQGVIHWPPQSRNLSLLAEESELPLPDNSVHKILVVHAMENSEHVRGMLSEIWRVLTPAGRMLVVAPNRLGIWARSPASPFALGHPFTSGQLRHLVSEHSFTPLHGSSAVFFPPSQRRYLLKSARLMEKVGRFFFPAFGGLLLLEAEKRLYAPVMQKARHRTSKAYLPAAQTVQGMRSTQKTGM